MGDLFDPFGMGSGSGVGSSVGSSRQASGPDLFGNLLGSDSSATSGFSSAHSNATPASNTSLFDLSKYTGYHYITEDYVPKVPLLPHEGNFLKKPNCWYFGCWMCLNR